VAALLARVGARQLARRDETGAVILDLEVPQSAYDAFIRGLARIGSWQPDAEPGELPARVPVTLRIVD
jgi:hypothetical protein